MRCGAAGVRATGGPAWIAVAARAAICAGAFLGCAQPQAPDAAPRAPARPSAPRVAAPDPAPVCGLALPCRETVPASHDLYGAMVQAAERWRSAIWTVDERTGCVSCRDPAAFLAGVLRDPEGTRGALDHVYLALAEAARGAFSGRRTADHEAVWPAIHEHAAREVARASERGSDVPCGLPSAYCASSPRFAEAFAAFADAAFFAGPADRDPGFVKELTVKIALTLDAPGALPAVLRFVRSGARVRARMKAIRDLCGYAERPDVREVLAWAARHDPHFHDRAAKCLAR